ncbi:ABC transporter permease [Oleiharenicola lentus]|uniref:ABC transporter permease n=1 Tax=Oleiharenicola lentus TaxID=2508720 RepID=UPI003F6771F8
MFTSLFRWEIRSLRRDPACWVATVLALAALGFALHHGGRWLEQLNQLRATAQSAETKATAEARALAAKLDAENNSNYGAARDPRDAAGYANRLMANFATLPATPLAALSIGQSDLLPAVLPLAPGTNPRLGGNHEAENPHRLLLGRFDAAFVVIHLAPLLIIALTYALLAGERERGTLALLLAQPLRGRQLVLGRFAPRLVLGIGLLAIFALAFVTLVPGSGGLRTLLWFGVAAGYGLFWFALSLAVAVRPGTAARHALVLAALWLGFVVLAPAAINLAVKTLHPVPSRVDLVLAMRAATDAASGERSKTLAAYYEDHPELAPKDAKAGTDFTLLRIATADRVERDLAPVLARYDEQLAQQQVLVSRLAVLSPALLAHTALADAAGTGLARHRDFIEQALAHHAGLREFFTPRIVRKEKFTAFDEVPVFRYAEETSGTILRHVALAGGLLFALATALFTWALRSVRHLSPAN